MVLRAEIVVPGRAALYAADAREALDALPGRLVHVIATSPPYWRQRSNGCPVVWGDACCKHRWRDTSVAGKIPTNGHKGTTLAGGQSKLRDLDGGARDAPSAVCRRCGAMRCELGQEPTPELYVAHLVEVLERARRVLRDDGTLWLNLDDTYIQKSLVGVPWMVAFALKAAGWYLRSAFPWLKRGGLPESCRDRPTCKLESVFLFSKGPRYFYDPESIRRPHLSGSMARVLRKRSAQHKYTDGGPRAQSITTELGLAQALGVGGRLRRSADWFFESLEAFTAGGEGFVLDPDSELPLAAVVNTRGYTGAHYSTWPPQLVRPMILAGSPEAACARCGAAHCGCAADETPAYVLDPFSGSATTGAVALELGRKYIGIDAVKANMALARRRLEEAANGPKGVTGSGVAVGLLPRGAAVEAG